MRAHLVVVLILVRHGQSTANAASLLVGRTDVELTEEGRAQARSLVGALDSVRVVISSPLRRALETARLALPGHELIVDDAFIEQDYGTHDGHALSDVPREQWREFRSSHVAALGGGESLADVDARVHARLDEWLDDNNSALHDDEHHVVVVSHVSPIKSAVAWALGVPGSVAWRLRLDNASLTTIAVRDSGAYLVNFNDVSARRGIRSLER